jgi:hypothetical protein
MLDPWIIEEIRRREEYEREGERPFLEIPLAPRTMKSGTVRYVTKTPRSVA